MDGSLQDPDFSCQTIETYITSLLHGETQFYSCFQWHG